ncbi:serine/threonine-protein phosphatase 7 [Phoenix dactylifera]|uniref:Serine/threonine-protein phosphatase n=1 Tax=Phoenix dactylifera TaxID=42345 RepID=A0A8B7CH68_PHODC|nr:serine/threonine-protein phosphatase 7 [Phoenix dactylifera]
MHLPWIFPRFKHETLVFFSSAPYLLTRTPNPSSPSPPPPNPLPTPSMSAKEISNPDLSSSATEATTPSPASTPEIALSWPSDGILTVEWIRALTAALDWASRHLPPSGLPSVLPFPVFHRLVLAASNLLHKERNCVTVDVGDEPCSVVVVGDVHGQLHDVIFLLEDAGFPSEDRFFVFNGDYVDRGAWGLETFVLLLAWKIFLPHRVFLLRGNHESKYCTSVYGFEKEVMVKYGDQGQQVYRKCLRCFEGLPLASIIAGCVYTAHGGLFRSMNIASSKRSKGKKGRKIVTNVNTNLLKLGSLEELQNARRTVLDPPWEGSNLIPGDVLWSDPSLKPGISPNEERGIGLLWGPDCTEEFLKKYNLKLIIRSHEGPDARDKRHDLTAMNDGYTIDHTVESGKLITLFSAPDYPQFQATEERFNNRGAYIVLQAPDFTSPEFHTFEAIKPRPQANAYYDFEEVIDSDEELDLQSMDHGSALEGITAIQTE